MKFQTTLLATLCLFVLSCGKTPAPTKVKGGQECEGCVADEKPTPAVAPHYAIDQFKTGQWIQWKGVSSTGAIQCVKWTFQKPTTHGYRILAQFSGNCQSWEEDYVEKIHFNAQTGEVLEDTILSGDSPPAKGDLETIYGHLYGSSEEVEFRPGVLNIKLTEKKYPAFQLLESKRYYLNQSGHAFHAVVLGWKQSDERSIDWTYQVVASDPALPEAPEE